MRIIVFLINAVIQLALAAAGFLVLLLAMNGYSEDQATPSLLLYIVCGLGSAVVLGLVSGFVANRLVERRSLGSLAASAVAVISFSIIGAIILVGIAFAAILLAEVMRGMR